MSAQIEFSLQDQEFIALCDLLKLAGVVDSGGQAKNLIAEGYVYRNGQVETRKTAKIRADERIELDGIVIEVKA
ncbi:RNA-binding protein [Pelistega indica]|uniref:RNA-binding protein n=1 Tax=Pelistega indica TaxID=1414851 RepID=V8FYJ0_9BURK|nr:RNA-binding S4 domain-containing protein [Pelistega indica]ETD69344.1 RNA-binding protein [Pelistega indica]